MEGWIDHNPNISQAYMEWIQRHESAVRALASGTTSPEDRKRLVEQMKQEIRRMDDGQKNVRRKSCVRG